MLLLLRMLPCKYFYQMSRNTDNFNHKITNREPYANLQKPTNATIISQEIMETNEEKTCIRQTSKVIHVKSRLAENKETKRQEEKESTN